MDNTRCTPLRNTVAAYSKLLGSTISKRLEGEFGIFQNGIVENTAQLGHLSDENQDYRQQIVILLKHIKTRGLKIQPLVKSLSGEV